MREYSPKLITESWGKLYVEDGVRKDFKDLSKPAQQKVQQLRNQIVNKLGDKLRDRTITQTIDNGEKITIGFTNEGIRHFVNDVMCGATSGRYFSQKDLLNIDKILSRSKYMGEEKARHNKREYFFRYAHKDGVEVFLKVGKIRRGGHDLYSFGLKND